MQFISEPLWLKEKCPGTRHAKIPEPERTEVREDYDIFTATQQVGSFRATTTYSIDIWEYKS